MITHSVPARVGLLGNPSDGYGGRTLALAVPKFTATVELEPADRLEIVPAPADEPLWDSVNGLVESVRHHGYGTGPQLLAATIATFADVMASVDRYDLGQRAFRLRYRTSIPRQVGLAGSSALVLATMRCLADLVDVELPPPVLASVALKVETQELGINAGLQDRVVQAYGGLVSMNFSEMEVDAHWGVAFGSYRQVDSSNLPSLFLAYRELAAEPSDRFHAVLRQRYEAGDGRIRELLADLAALAVQGEMALRWNDSERFASLLERNMELRRQLAPIADAQLELVDVAQSCNAPATFTGSGGAIVGAVTDDAHFARVAGALNAIGAAAVRLDADSGENA